MRYFLRIHGLRFLCLALWPALCAVAATQAADRSTPLLMEEFKYASWDREIPNMSETWEKVLGHSLQVVTDSTDPNLPTPHVHFINAIAATELKNAPAGDFSVSAQVLFSAYSRSLWFGLLPENGTSGVIAVWTSANPDQHQGQGFVCLREIELDMRTEARAANTPVGFSKELTQAVSSGQPAVNNTEEGLTASFVTITLSFESKRNEWTLYVDDRLLGTTEAEVPMGEKLTHLYIGGGTGALFKQISVTPEAYSP